MYAFDFPRFFFQLSPWATLQVTLYNVPKICNLDNVEKTVVIMDEF